jgi:hypothetical protein
VEGADGQCGDRPRDNNKNIVVNLLHRVLDRAVTTRGARLGMTRGRAGRSRGGRMSRARWVREFGSGVHTVR